MVGVWSQTLKGFRHLLVNAAMDEQVAHIVRSLLELSENSVRTLETQQGVIMEPWRSTRTYNGTLCYNVDETLMRRLCSVTENVMNVMDNVLRPSTTS